MGPTRPVLARHGRRTYKRSMSLPDDQRLGIVRAYHERTKHRPDRFAASLGYLDWANQPDPFRTFAETAYIDLPRPAIRLRPSYDDLFEGGPEGAHLDDDCLGRLFLNSLALSAWKQAPGTRPWSLRINPSSGDLHPTEAYLVTGPVAGLIDRPGVFHYTPFGHRLERRCGLLPSQWHRLTGRLPSPCLLIGLTSIYGIGRPCALSASSPSRITTRPRITVIIGQPVISRPSKGDQPQREASQSSSMVRLAARSTSV